MDSIKGDEQGESAGSLGLVASMARAGMHTHSRWATSIITRNDAFGDKLTSKFAVRKRSTSSTSVHVQPPFALPSCHDALPRPQFQWTTSAWGAPKLHVRDLERSCRQDHEPCVWTDAKAEVSA